MKNKFAIIFIGICIFIFAVTFGWIIYSPNEQEAQMNNDNAQKAETEGDKLSQAQKRVALAKAQVASQAARWREIEAVRTPSSSLATGGINLDENGWQLTVDAAKYRNDLQREVNNQVKKGGVKVIQGPFITNPSDSGSTILADYFNYPAIPFPVVIFDLGQIQVQGNWNQIMSNVESWANMPNYIAVADGLSISGTAPYLTGTYSVSIVGYIKDNKLYPPVPEGAPASSSGGAAGAPRGAGMMGGGMKGGMSPGMRGKPGA